jgi:hypothetical protein
MICNYDGQLLAWLFVMTDMPLIALMTLPGCKAGATLQRRENACKQWRGEEDRDKRETR